MKFNFKLLENGGVVNNLFSVQENGSKHVFDSHTSKNEEKSEGKPAADGRDPEVVVRLFPHFPGLLSGFERWQPAQKRSPALFRCFVFFFFLTSLAAYRAACLLPV